MDIQTVTGAPGTIMLGGKPYLVAPPVPEDMGTIGAYLKQHAKSPVAALRDDPDFAYLPEDVQQERLRDAARRKFSDSQPFDPVSALEVLTSLEGTRFIAWVLLRKLEKAITYDQIVELVTRDNFERVSVELDIASGMAALGNAAGPPGSQVTGGPSGNSTST